MISKISPQAPQAVPMWPFRHRASLTAIFIGSLLWRLPTAVSWGAGHAQVHSAALALQDESMRALLNQTTLVWPPGSSVAPTTLDTLLSGPLAESADDVAGPCSANESVPCSASALAVKMTLRDFCYAENETGGYTRPWPYAVPQCNATTGLPPPGWTACLSGPKTWSWLYHYFTETPPQNAGFEARGAAWYIGRAADAFRKGNATEATLLLGCFAHGLEDRSSPYHCWGGDDAGKAAIETRYNLTDTCRALAPPSQRGRCEIIFWGADDTHIDVAASEYVPAVLGSTPSEAGAAVGARMEVLANMSREIAVQPGGYVATHLEDANWWTGAASPATKNVEGRMATQSTRLVADAWHTAWMLSRSTGTMMSADQAMTQHQHRQLLTEADVLRWRAAVDRAAAADRAEPNHR